MSLALHAALLALFPLHASSSLEFYYGTSLIQGTIQLERKEGTSKLEPAELEQAGLLGQLQQDVETIELMDASSRKRHPVWHFEPSALYSKWAIICSVVLFLAGVLCSAGGIGGGGIYVTVLMVAGHLDVVDAIPLSKAIVFFGSLSSLVLNLRKSFQRTRPGEASTQVLIDYNICRLVVPGTLLGTFLGVFLNRKLPSWLILMLLLIVLAFISVQVTRDCVRQFFAEREAMRKEGDANTTTKTTEDVSDSGSTPGAISGPAQDQTPQEVSKEQIAVNETLQALANPTLRTRLGKCDFFLVVSLLIAVILCGIFRFHSGECERAPFSLKEERCNHPALFWLGHGTLQTMMENSTKAVAFRATSVVIPLIGSGALAVYFCFMLWRFAGWTLREMTMYCAMSIITGILAGLVGIGGGLIFAPFFLLMGNDPAIAVATSSTCVIFTSSSTSFQYLLTDRIIMSLTVVYGLVNLCASYVGTNFVHWLQDHYSTRKSFISGIVLTGVGISMVLCAVKFFQAIKDPSSVTD